MLTTFSNTSLRTAQRLLKFTSGIGVGADRLHVIAYGLGGDDALGPQELGELLQREIFCVLPPDDAAPTVQNAAYAALAAKLGLAPESRFNGRT